MSEANPDHRSCKINLKFLGSTFLHLMFLLGVLVSSNSFAYELMGGKIVLVRPIFAENPQFNYESNKIDWEEKMQDRAQKIFRFNSDGHPILMPVEFAPNRLSANSITDFQKLFSDLSNNPIFQQAMDIRSQFIKTPLYILISPSTPFYGAGPAYDESYHWLQTKNPGGQSILTKINPILLEDIAFLKIYGAGEANVSLDSLINDNLMAEILSHEMTHEICSHIVGEANYTVYNSLLTNKSFGHDVHVVSDPTLAFTEGFAEAFSAFLYESQFGPKHSIPTFYTGLLMDHNTSIENEVLSSIDPRSNYFARLNQIRKKVKEEASNFASAYITSALEDPRRDYIMRDQFSWNDRPADVFEVIDDLKSLGKAVPTYRALSPSESMAKEGIIASIVFEYFKTLGPLKTFQLFSQTRPINISDFVVQSWQSLSTDEQAKLRPILAKHFDSRSQRVSNNVIALVTERDRVGAKEPRYTWDETEKIIAGFDEEIASFGSENGFLDNLRTLGSLKLIRARIELVDPNNEGFFSKYRDKSLGWYGGLFLPGKYMEIDFNFSSEEQIAQYIFFLKGQAYSDRSEDSGGVIKSLFLSTSRVFGATKDFYVPSNSEYREVSSAIIKARAGGPFINIYDLLRRIDVPEYWKAAISDSVDLAKEKRKEEWSKVSADLGPNDLSSPVLKSILSIGNL